VYIWGDSWESAKRHAECLHYLFDLSIRQYQLQLGSKNPSQLSLNMSSNSCCYCHSLKTNSIDASSYKYVLLDIEGTTTPITFVKDVLFPYARANVRVYLHENWTNFNTQRIILAFIDIIKENLANNIQSDYPKEIIDKLLGNNQLDREICLDPLVSYIQICIDKDLKISPLKELQGYIWKLGYNDGSLVAQVYDDVPSFLSRMRHANVKVCIYSSGSREAQRLLFKHSEHGDLRPYLSSYFDTAVGMKRQSSSYNEIKLSLGVDNGNDVLFVTDIYEEALAAQEAGLDAVISVRPGNGDLPAHMSFNKINSFNEL
jgi:methylthioribulose 1-phosphate dehydratase/enolase-phosphatase E1